MSKVVSGRINDDLYQKITEDGRSHNDIVNAALDWYYSNADNVSTEVNKEIFEDKYRRLCAIIDKYLDGDK